jgi:predicted flavoprotein YhiN
VTDLRREDDCWAVQLSSGETLRAERVILATGGLSVPATGSDGVGLRIALELGQPEEWAQQLRLADLDAATDATARLPPAAAVLEQLRALGVRSTDALVLYDAERSLTQYD